MNEHVEYAALILLLAKKKAEDNSTKIKTRKKRQFKVRPLNQKRFKNGFYKSYFLKMKDIDPSQFFKYTRMDIPTFNNLVNLITPLVQKKNMNHALEPEERLAITLHYLSQGSSMQTVAWKYNIGKTTVHCVIKETCKAICHVLEPQHLKMPQSEEEWTQVATGFLKKWNFPHCIGALDGKHIRMKAPKRSGSLYYNYLKTFSLVLLAACDSDYKILMADIGGYGSVSDGGTLRDSVFGEKLCTNALNIPDREPIVNCVTNTAFPYYFVADSAFPLTEHIIRPYPGTLLPPVRENFNKRLSRARRLIENTFGILAARWRILYQTINADVSLVELVTRTCICLHNLLCKSGSLYCPPGYVDIGDEDNGQWRTDLPTPLRSITGNSRNAKHNLYSLRDELARYFFEEGQI